MKTTGIVLYDGPSKLNGKPIITIATLKSQNIKTGKMISCWTLPKSYPPTVAIDLGEDDAVCNCNLRGTLATVNGKTKNVGRICYVLNYQAPTTIYHKYHRGGYAPLDKNNIALFKNRMVRFGVYGCPTATPIKIIHDIVKLCRGWTAFTSGWRNGHNKIYQQYCQASVNSVIQAKEAQQRGWKTFRVSEDGLPLKNETVCSSIYGVKCVDCGICNGNTANVVIKIHGTKGKINSFSQLQNRIEK